MACIPCRQGAPITGRFFCFAFVAGAALTQTLAELPGPVARAALVAAILLAALALRRPRRAAWKLTAALALGLSAGLFNASWQAQARLDDGLSDAHHDQVARLMLQVTGLPDGDARRWRFVADTLEPAPPGIPSRLLVTWHASPDGPDLPALAPGQVWRMALVLRRPAGLRNAGLPDAEGRMFALGLRATGTVRGQPKFVADHPWAGPGVVIERARHRIRAGMRRALDGYRYAPVLIALAIGDQAGVAREDWRLFNRSGITHLVSISGMHVTSIAGVAGMLAAFLWRRARWRGIGLAERAPSRIVGGMAAAWVALLYCLLAGWGVPARRTFFMLATVLAAAMSRLPLTGGRVLAVAAALVTALDPWAPMAPGFWLSFGAVAILLRIVAAPVDPSADLGRRVAARLGQASHLQLLVTLGLTPLLAFWVGQVSVGSPLANAVAIPAVSFLVTPLSLLCALFAAIPGAERLAAGAGQAGLAVFDLTMMPVAWVGEAAWASFDVAAAPWPWLLLALAGMAWALQARGWPGRHCGWLWMLPLLCWRPERPEPGYWRLTALDVGQGGAVLLETATRTLLFDAGPRHRGGSDVGEWVVAPYLRARGIRMLDDLVLSHVHMDHVGGTRAVLNAVAVGRSHASFDLDAFLARDAREARISEGRADAGAYVPPVARLRCARGQAWEADGLRFAFLHPLAAEKDPADPNADSCVLRVQGARHSLLLTGDIGVAQERALAPALPPTDVVMAPHHGSATSSSLELIAATRAGHVIAQAGMLNRFRHPAPAVEHRWTAAGVRFWRSDRDGAVVAESLPAELRVRGERQRNGRYWQGR